MNKTCSECLVNKDVVHFNKNVNAIDGLQNACRECANAKRRVPRDGMLGAPVYHYVCSSYEYPTADEVDEDAITMQVHAVCNTLDASIEYMFELIQCLNAPHDTDLEVQRATTMVWDPINDVLRLRYKCCGTVYIVSRIEVYNAI